MRYYFLTVTDGNIREVAESLKRAGISDRIICHCSGALSSEIFSDITGCTGYSVHPFFAINNKYDSYKELTSTLFTIEGPDTHRDCVASLIRQCGNKVIFIQPDMKARYHGAAVFASNLLMGLMETAVDELATCGFSKEDALTAIYPLALNNLKHLENNSLEDSLTGPLERNDVSTVRKHLGCFKGDDRMMYILLSRKALEIAKRKNSDRDYREMEDLLYDNSHYTYEYETEGR